MWLPPITSLGRWLAEMTVLADLTRRPHWRDATFGRQTRRARPWTPVRPRTEKRASERRRRQIAAGRLTAANGLITVE